MGCGDVEQHNLVRALSGVAMRQLGGVARVDDVDKLHALDDAAAAHIETGDDSFRQHLQLHKVPKHAQADVGGLLWMELHAHDILAFDG